jgi:hypothetical protein
LSTVSWVTRPLPSYANVVVRRTLLPRCWVVMVQGPARSSGSPLEEPKGWLLESGAALEPPPLPPLPASELPCAEEPAPLEGPSAEAPLLGALEFVGPDEPPVEACADPPDADAPPEPLALAREVSPPPVAGSELLLTPLLLEDAPDPPGSPVRPVQAAVRANPKPTPQSHPHRMQTPRNHKGPDRVWD